MSEPIEKLRGLPKLMHSIAAISCEEDGPAFSALADELEALLPALEQQISALRFVRDGALRQLEQESKRIVALEQREKESFNKGIERAAIRLDMLGSMAINTSEQNEVLQYAARNILDLRTAPGPEVEKK